MRLGEFRGGLHAGQPGAADRDGGAGRQRAQAGGEPFGGLGTVEGVSMLVGTGHGVRVRNAAERVDEGVVADGEIAVEAHRARVRVDAGDPAADELDAGAGQEFGDPQIGGGLAGGRLVQPQPLGEAVARVHQRDADVGAPAQAAR